MEEKNPLRILILADGRSPIVHRWLEMLAPLHYHICLVSSSPCAPVAGADCFYILPLAFSTLGGSQAGGGAHPNILTGLVKRFRPLAQKARTWLGPWTLALKKNRLRQIIALNQPDIIHAFRIPFEGMLAGMTNANLPLIISTWGNDFTLHAPATRQMGKITRKVMSIASALLSDTQIDVKRAAGWGFDSQKPSLVVPGNGGINLADMQEVSTGVIKSEPFRILNPRGLRSYVHSDTFFKAIPLVLDEIPDAIFSCTSMQGQPEAETWVHRLGIENNVDLLPLLTQKELWREFARSHVSVSVSSHDGTPNTLLEAMASGCLPICGDLPSIREWITPGENGLLVNPLEPEQLAESIILSLRNPEFLQKAARMNLQLISQHADIEIVRRSISDFYALVHSKGVK